jgi:nucleoside-diphosphate-sugar epimerase
MPVLMDPPKWPFLPEQRVEFINRADVVVALLASVEKEEAAGKILNIAGGRSWQMRGKEFVAELYSILDIPAKDAEDPERPVYGDWDDTDESQAILNYQRTPFPRFLELLNQAVEEALG